MSQRIDWIDALKGLAILLVVFGHCVDDSISSNTFPVYAFNLQILHDFIYSFHMPLFFAISGFVFYLSKSYRKFKYKVWDFTVVYVIWSFLMWLSKYFMAKDINNPVTILDLLSIVYKPIMIYWYLFVLIFMYIIASLLKWYKVDNVLLIGAAVVAVCSKLLNLDIGIVNAILYYEYFFLAGGYCYNNDLLTKIKKKHILVFSVLLFLVYFGYLYYLDNTLFMVINKFIIANFTSLVLFYLVAHMKPNKLFILFGTYTLQIYVMHCFFTAGLRVAFKHLAISNIYLYFVLGIILGILVPIITAKNIKNVPV